MILSLVCGSKLRIPFYPTEIFQNARKKAYHIDLGPLQLSKCFFNRFGIFYRFFSNLASYSCYRVNGWHRKILCQGISQAGTQHSPDQQDQRKVESSRRRNRSVLVNLLVNSIIISAHDVPIEVRLYMKALRLSKC